jgi:hypothetical protein
MSLLDKEVAAEMTGKWLKAAEVESMEFMTEEQVTKCTEFVQKKIGGIK